MVGVDINRLFAEVTQDELNKDDAYLLPDGRYDAKYWAEIGECLSLTHLLSMGTFRTEIPQLRLVLQSCFRCSCL